jgi:hypothetical protein
MEYDCKTDEIKPIEEASTQHTGSSMQGSADEKWLDFNILQVPFA